MTKLPEHVEKERDRLAEQATSPLPDRYDGRYHPKVVGRSWYKEGFNDAWVLAEKEVEGYIEMYGERREFIKDRQTNARALQTVSLERDKLNKALDCAAELFVDIKDDNRRLREALDLQPECELHTCSGINAMEPHCSCGYEAAQKALGNPDD